MIIAKKGVHYLESLSPTQFTFTYQYDDNYNIIGITVKNGNGTIIDDYDYYYDGFSQLTRENIILNQYTVEEYKITKTYTYDSQGNIATIKEYTYTTGSISGTPLYKKIMYYDYDWADQLSKIEEYSGTTLTNNTDITYDASGNPLTMTDLIAGATGTYTWDGRQLNSYTIDTAEGGGTIYYKYNDQGIRTSKTVFGTLHTYILDGDKVLIETWGTHKIYYTYDVDGSLISMNYDGNEYFYIKNMQGDIIELVSINGITVVKYKYDAWGNIEYMYDSGLGISIINPYRYRGYRFDSETGLYYLQSRYYNPEIGRFISSDGLVGGIGDIQNHNMYAYCANNPVMYVDPTGEFLQWIIIPPLLLAALAALVVVYTISLFNDEILDFVDEAIKTIESEFEKTLEKEYTVYTLIDGEGTVKYVGRVKTANYGARMEYHRNTKGLLPGPKIDNLNYWECRGIEQLGILAHSTGWFDVKTNPSGNKINGIGRFNPFRFDYYGAGIRYIWNNLENEWTNLVN